MAKQKEKNQLTDEQVINAYTEQINYLQNLISQMQQNIEDIEKLKADLKEAEQLEKGQEILAPIANGIFIKAAINDSSTLLINIGKGIVVEKTIPETIELLDSQQKEIDASRSDTISKLEQLYAMLYKRSIEG